MLSCRAGRIARATLALTTLLSSYSFAWPEPPVRDPSTEKDCLNESAQTSMLREIEELDRASKGKGRVEISKDYLDRWFGHCSLEAGLKKLQRAGFDVEEDTQLTEWERREGIKKTVFGEKTLSVAVLMLSKNCRIILREMSQGNRRDTGFFYVDGP